jgi:hypothetical protein
MAAEDVKDASLACRRPVALGVRGTGGRGVLAVRCLPTTTYLERRGYGSARVHAATCSGPVGARWSASGASFLVAVMAASGLDGRTRWTRIRCIPARSVYIGERPISTGGATPLDRGHSCKRQLCCPGLLYPSPAEGRICDGLMHGGFSLDCVQSTQTLPPWFDKS